MAGSYAYNTTAPAAGASNREDLRQLSTILEPEKTPVSSMIKRTKATALYHEWTLDSLSDVDTSGVIEGTDVDAFADKFENLDRVGNRVQKFRRTYKVSDWQETVESAAPVNIARAEMKAIKEIKRDIEAAILSDNDRVVGSGSTAAKLRGLGDWLDSAGPSDVSTDYRTPAASLDTNGVSITEIQFNDIIQSLHNQSGEVNSLHAVLDSGLRSAVSQFTRTTGSTDTTHYAVNQNAEGKKMTLAVNIYDSDFGFVKILTSNPKCSVVPTVLDRGYIINPSYLALSDFASIRSKRLEDQGGGPRGYVDCSLTLECLSPLAHGKIS
jgi:hypothetical protein